MAAQQSTRPTAHNARPSAPFDRARSAKLDELIIKLDAMPPRFRARIYRVQKRWLERHVPALFCEVR